MEILTTALFWAVVYIVACFFIAIFWAIWENKPLREVIWGVAKWLGGFTFAISMVVVGIWLFSTIR